MKDPQAQGTPVPPRLASLFNQIVWDALQIGRCKVHDGRGGSAALPFPAPSALAGNPGDAFSGRAKAGVDWKNGYSRSNPRYLVPW